MFLRYVSLFLPIREPIVCAQDVSDENKPFPVSHAKLDPDSHKRHFC